MKVLDGMISWQQCVNSHYLSLRAAMTFHCRHSAPLHDCKHWHYPVDIIVSSPELRPCRDLSDAGTTFSFDSACWNVATCSGKEESPSTMTSARWSAWMYSLMVDVLDVFVAGAKVVGTACAWYSRKLYDCWWLWQNGDWRQLGRTRKCYYAGGLECAWGMTLIIYPK